MHAMTGMKTENILYNSIYLEFFSIYLELFAKRQVNKERK